jgi:hypothetical protein
MKDWLNVLKNVNFQFLYDDDIALIESYKKKLKRKNSIPIRASNENFMSPIFGGDSIIEDSSVQDIQKGVFR